MNESKTKEISTELKKKVIISMDRIKTKTETVVRSAKRGHPKLVFNRSSKRTKRRRIAQLSKIDESASMALRCKMLSTEMCKANIDEVLSLFIETNMSKHQYILIRTFATSYKLLSMAKASSYPDKISVSESQAEVDLQSLVDHTASRIIRLQNDVLDSIGCDLDDNLVLIGKWGFDGSTGHSEYKQKFMNNDMNDTSLFVTSYVPLQLKMVGNDPKHQKIIWKNPRPSSTRYCRPIRFQFQKETSQLAVNEEKYFKDKIELLKPTICTISNNKIIVEHSLQLTMVDGKICNALSEISSSTYVKRNQQR
ncbi:uncharacterized protein LOC105219976 [Zeugodacus cucurbitae]|uniref:uncharacterized protein LOC105219976 n=1 Tax=Zeugodacus cucurbitae TaxID=28588 RepID=UPI0023D951D1|nr:uncharacterized protein LOC105219976 [Zeugodacus cucurbitae]